MTRDLKIVPVKWIDEVLDLALERPLAPKKASKEKARKAASRVTVRGKSRSTPGTRVKH